MTRTRQLHITLAGREHVVDAATTAAGALGVAERATGPVAVIAARVNGELRGLDVVEPVEIASDDGRAILRRSVAHVMAQAVQGLFPEAKLGTGAPVENGFYYDFDVPHPFGPGGLKAIGQGMRAIVRQGQRFSRRVVSEDAARAELAGEPYKLELAGLMAGGAAEEDAVGVGGGGLTMYDNLDPVSGEVRWKDLCRGPHLPTTGHIPAFKLMRSSGAYWRGREENPQLQRIYGTAWESRQAQDAYLRMLAEAERRDHRRLGAELDLFSFPPQVGSGLPVFHPKGGTIRKVMEDYSRSRHEEAGYEFVSTPHIAKSGLFETSGHLDWFSESMYPPMEVEGARYYLKPMNCPFHILIFNARGRSYRELPLPLRLFEFGTVYRFEKSGVVHGLTRVRGLTMDDAHIFCGREQAGEELKSLLGFVLSLLRDYSLDDFYLELSTRGEAKEKFAGSDEDWEQATVLLREAAESSGLDVAADPAGAAFYGPKISVQARDALGRTWQLSTIQLDFTLPQRFGMEYQAADGSRRRPVMIHRALFWSIERFFGILLEHYAGAFPPWLAPVQVVCIPVADAHAPYLGTVADRLRERGIRAEVDDSPSRMQKKIRNAQRQMAPYMLLAGDDDIFLPYDHGLEHGPRDFFGNPAAGDPRYVIRLAREGGFNGIALQVGLAEKFFWDFAGEVPLILKLNGKTDIPADSEALSPLHACVADAVRLGADAVGYTLHVGTPAAEADFRQYRQVRQDAQRFGMPLVVWAYPCGAAIAAKGGRNSRRGRA